MDPIISRCGYRCDLCLAYRPNSEGHPEIREKLSDGWFRYFGFRLPPESLVCDGCRSEEQGHRIDDTCPVRPCVIEKGLQDCADCEEYVCEKLRPRIVRFEEVQVRVEGRIPDEDRLAFLHPYENATRLEALRLMRRQRRGGR
ncbi:MAG: DUF3795 domain-containing protein [Candidatus Eisenbacteria bacterium]|nr:DUF3795 domain-containing protein [Candidatus Eisenbacteria bacterium]